MKPLLRLSQRAGRTAEQPISYLMHQAVANPELISLAAGLVDQESLPADETLAALTELLSDHEAAHQSLQYGTTQGHERLRELLVEHLEQLEGCSAREMGLDAGHVVITTGSQQFLQLLSDVLLDPDDIVLIGSPDYFVFMGVLTGLGARVVGVPLDERGIVPEALDEALAGLDSAGQLERVKLVYCCSYSQNPSGVTLASERRARVLEIVRKWSRVGRIFLLEDAAYRELYYTEPAPRSIRSFDNRGETVILTQTFSKPYSPGLKTGYSVLPDELLGPVLREKGNQDFGSSNFNQHLLARLMESGRYQEHVTRLREIYRTKLTAMLDALEQEFRGLDVAARWTRPAGGLYVWLTLPESVDTGRSGKLFQRCLENSVLYVPGEYCFPAERLDRGLCPLGGPSHTMRLSFGVQPVDRIREGIARLAAGVAECYGRVVP